MVEKMRMTDTIKVLLKANNLKKLRKEISSTSANNVKAVLDALIELQKHYSETSENGISDKWEVAKPADEEKLYVRNGAYDIIIDTSPQMREPITVTAAATTETYTVSLTRGVTFVDIGFDMRIGFNEHNNVAGYALTIDI